MEKNHKQRPIYVSLIPSQGSALALGKVVTGIIDGY